VPSIFRYKGYRFFFYSNEGDPLEPLHVHVIRGESVAKFWVEPEVSIAESYGMKSAELTMLRKVVSQNKDVIKRAWDGYFSK